MTNYIHDPYDKIRTQVARLHGEHGIMYSRTNQILIYLRYNFEIPKLPPRFQFVSKQINTRFGATKSDPNSRGDIGAGWATACKIAFLGEVWARCNCARPSPSVAGVVLATVWLIRLCLEMRDHAIDSKSKTILAVDDKRHGVEYRDVW